MVFYVITDTAFQTGDYFIPKCVAVGNRNSVFLPLFGRNWHSDIMDHVADVLDSGESHTLLLGLKRFSVWEVSRKLGEGLWETVLRCRYVLWNHHDTAFRSYRSNRATLMSRFIVESGAVSHSLPWIDEATRTYPWVWLIAGTSFWRALAQWALIVALDVAKCYSAWFMWSVFCICST